MCGIAGIINLNQKPVNKKDLEKMIKLVNYRGPDDDGYFVKENIGFEHCRLSIIDLSKAGHQPMSNENTTIWIVYNGEIYNYLELGEELKRQGHTFKSKTDTEVIIHSYEEWGEDCFKKFNGDWALAILDLNKKKIILSRDRFSVKPLYYTISNKTFYFGSETKQLLPFLEKKELNRDVMFKYLKQGLIDFNQETFFKAVYKVKPKYNLIVDLATGKITETQYWDYHLEEIPGEQKEMTEKFKELFRDSVKIRLRSDVPIGSLLSGGLDSSSISVVAKELTEGELNCFSVVSKEKNILKKNLLIFFVRKKI